MIDDVIFVHVRDGEAAVRALRYKVLHFELAACQQPYVELVNQLLEGVNAEARRRTEVLTERIRQAIDAAG